MRPTLPINATWISDRHFLVPTLLSIYSFRKHVETYIRLIYTDHYHDKAELQALLPNVEIQFFTELDITIPNHLQAHQATILNRLARMHAVESCSKDQYLFLIDSDTIFSKTISNLVNLLTPKVKISGVVEYEEVANAYLYFATKTNTGSTHSLSQVRKNRVFEAVFGSNWLELVKTPQFNNGFLVFRNASVLAQQWRALYIKGLSNPSVNHQDDQVPLAIATQQLNIKTTPLPNQYNSKGNIYGQYSMYHAWMGRWQWDLIKIACGQHDYLSDYGQIALQYWNNLPISLQATFWDTKIKPFQYQQLLANLQNTIKKGQKIVELNSINSYSSFWIAERIEDFELDYDLIFDKYNPDELSIGFLMYTLQKNGFWQFCNVFFDLPQSCASNYSNNSIDLLIIGFPDNYNASFLKNWWSKISKGGQICLMLLNTQTTIDLNSLNLDSCTIKNFAPIYILHKS
ncbi:MAG: hypothetical protein GY810_06155 [Aureispira sp.]|nr:hypothetical protein [Aureispira sp.]